MRKNKEVSCLIYSYFAEKMQGYVEERPNIISVDKAQWVIATHFHIPSKALRNAIIEDMKRFNVLSRVNRYKLAISPQKAIMDNLSSVYHSLGMW